MAMKHEIHVDEDSLIPSLLINNYCFLLHSLTRTLTLSDFRT